MNSPGSSAGRRGNLSSKSPIPMDYTFASERKIVMAVQCGGRNRLVEFGDRNENGVSVFCTSDPLVAKAIRRTSLSRRGIIVETTREPEPAPQPTASSRPAAKGESKPSQEAPKPNVREYDNFTVAREAIVREFGLKKNDVRNPTALARAASEHGFSIKYRNAEK